MTPPPLVATMRECTDPACRFRYPIPDPEADRSACPLCGGPTAVANQAPFPRPQGVAPSVATPPRPVDVLLDNIRSTFNVGAILRTADGAGIRHVHLAGITPWADNPKVVKTALGAETVVPWSYHRNGVDAVKALKAQGSQIWALDVYATGTLLPDAIRHHLPQGPDGQAIPILLVVGNEVTGIDPAIVALADQLITIPMNGSKRSLNVAVAFGVAAYFLTQAH